MMPTNRVYPIDFPMSTKSPDERTQQRRNSFVKPIKVDFSGAKRYFLRAG